MNECWLRNVGRLAEFASKHVIPLRAMVLASTELSRTIGFRFGILMTWESLLRMAMEVSVSQRHQNVYSKGEGRTGMMKGGAADINTRYKAFR